MKVPRVVTIALLAILSLWAIVSLVGSGRSTPAMLLEDVQVRFDSGSADGRLLVRDLQRALDDPRSAGDEEVLAGILLLRSQVYESLNDMSNARGDLERVLTLYRRDDPGLELRAARLEAADGLVAEALARARRLAQGSEDSAVWYTIGQLESEQALAELALANDLVRSAIYGHEAEAIIANLSELAKRDPLDRGRRPLADAVRAGFPSVELDRIKAVLDAADAASQHNRAARGALSLALAAGFDAGGARTLIDLLRAAGRPELALDLAQVVRLDPNLAGDPGVFEAALDAMVELGHVQRASFLIQGFSWKVSRPSRELCEKALRVLLQAGELRRCAPVLSALKKTQAVGAGLTADFYQGLQLTERAKQKGDADLWNLALKRWNDFLAAGGKVEPVPGARALGFVQRSIVKHALGDINGEREDLLRALTPPASVGEAVWLTHVTSEDYQRMANLTSKARNSGYRGPEQRWTQAMSLAPRRWEEMLPRWALLGETALDRDAGYSLNEVYSSAINSGGTMPVMDVGPHTLYEVARMHLRRGNYEGAMTVARGLVARYPGLIPARDVVIEAQIQRGSRLQVMIDLLNRLELTGPDEHTAGLLAELGEDVLRPHQRLEWMRLDPAGMGARTLARHALQQGAPQAALRALGSAPQEPGDEDAALRLVRAEALFDLDRSPEAMTILQGLREDPLHADAALDLELLVTITAGTLPGEASAAISPELDQVVALMVTRLAGPAPPAARALRGVDMLLAAGRPGPAASLLEALDGRVETRGGGVLERMVLHARMVEDREGVIEALERSEAFFGDGRVELRRLILAIEDRDWRRLPTLAIEARAPRGDELDPWLDGLLLVLEERLDEGLELAREGLAADPRSPRWALLVAAAADLAEETSRPPAALGRTAVKETAAALRGDQATGRDPRELLGLLLSIEFAGWAPSAPVACAELRERGGGELWPAWLEARSLERQGRGGEAFLAYQDLAAAQPTFGPAWDGLERQLISADGNVWSPTRVRARAGRHAAGAGHGLGKVALALDETCSIMSAGDRGAAIAHLRGAMGEAEQPKPNAARLLGYLHLAGGEPKSAVGAYVRALPPKGRVSDDPSIARLVTALVAAAQPGVKKQHAMPQQRVAEQLEQLTRDFPRDPLPPLAWAQLRSDFERRNPALLVDVITRTFQGLRTRTRGVTLSSLRPGAAEDWGELLLEIAPDVAEAALLEDLAITPGDLELWRLLAQTVAVQGRSEDALDLYTAVVQMSRDPATLQAYAWFLLEHGAGEAQVQAQLARAERSSGDDPLDPNRARFVAALTELRLSNRPNLTGLIPTLGDLWKRRRSLKSVPSLLLGRAYVSALMMRRQPADRAALKEVLDQLGKAGERDPYLADVARAIAGVDAHLPAPELTPETAPLTNEQKQQRRRENKQRERERAAQEAGEKQGD